MRENDHVGCSWRNRYFAAGWHGLECRGERGIISRLKHWAIRTWERMQETQDRIATTWRPERILVVHVMKTAGTSLRRRLQQEYGPRRVYTGDPHLNRLPNGFYLSGQELLRNFRGLPPHKVNCGCSHISCQESDREREREAV